MKYERSIRGIQPSGRLRSHPGVESHSNGGRIGSVPRYTNSAVGEMVSGGSGAERAEIAGSRSCRAVFQVNPGRSPKASKKSESPLRFARSDGLKRLG